MTAVTNLKKNLREKLLSPLDFPDWRDIGEYGDYKSWSNRRWAWEFLRRNVAYVSSCKRHKVVIGRRNQNAEEAAEYGRRDLKHYLEPYGADDDERYWLAESVAEWTRVALHKGKRVEHLLELGQISLVFDLTQTDIAGTAAITAMMDHVREILEKELPRYLERNLIGPLGAAIRKNPELKPKVKSRRPERDPEIRIRWLRTYDAMELGKAKAKEVVECLFSHVEAKDDIGIEETYLVRSKALSACRVRARKIVKGEYRIFVPLDYIQDKRGKEKQ